MLRKKILLIWVLSSFSILTQAQGFKGTCIGIWAKVKSYVGLDGQGGKIKTFEEINEFLSEIYALKPEILRIQKARQLDDIPFGEVYYGKRKYDYAKLPLKVRTVPEGNLLFYGKAANSLADAVGQTKSLFARGRARNSEKSHRDIKTHIASTKDAPSNFLQTTHSYEIAEFFAQGHKTESPKSHGVVFILNPKGLETLDVDRFLIHAWKVSKFVQKEVLINQNLAPERVVAAVILERKNDVWVPVHYYQNSLAEL